MKRGAFSIVEVVAALALLGMLSVAVSSWMITTVRLDRELAGDVHSQNGLLAAVTVIEADIRAALAAADDGVVVAVSPSASELLIDPGMLDADSTGFAYSLEGGRMTRAATDATQRVLLVGVGGFDVIVDEDLGWLEITISLEDGSSRSVAAPIRRGLPR